MSNPFAGFKGLRASDKRSPSWKSSSIMGRCFRRKGVGDVLVAVTSQKSTARRKPVLIA